jgi:hypothetical protein
MGKTRGHGSRRGAYRGARANASKGRGEEEEDSSEEEYEQPKGVGRLGSQIGSIFVQQRDMNQLCQHRAWKPTA